MKKILVTLLVALALAAFGTGEALAKAGSTSKSSGGSFGSKGSRTYDAPMERTLTPPPTLMTPPTTPSRPAGPPPVPQAAPRGGNVDAAPLAPGAMAAQQPGFAQRNPFMAGLAGGVIGAGIGSMLFGHSPAMASASEAAPFASMLGLLLQVAVIGGLIWLGIRLFRGGSRAEMANPYSHARRHVEPDLTGGYAAPLGQPQQLRISKEYDPTAADQQAFTEILQGVQQAWSEGNLAAMRRWATPEVVSFLSEDLSRNASEGLLNKVENVALLKGDVSEAWSENGFDYLTAVLSFQCVDYMVRADSGAVAKGSPAVPVTHTEAWTFVRSAGGGRWLLSAVEQVQ